MPKFSHDVIICGHGLAGAVLIQQLIDRGLSFHVLDKKAEGNASEAAAGLINPISLRRDVLTWRAPEMLEFSMAFYQKMEERLGAELWHPTELIKIFPTANEEAQWRRAMAREETRSMLSLGSSISNVAIKMPFGSGTIKTCAWLDIQQMLHLQRIQLLSNGSFTERWVDHTEIRSCDKGISIGDHSARWIVHCNGPFSSCPGLVPVKGEVLTVRIPDLQLDRIIHCGIFILPIGDDLYRIGSTFQWDDVWSGPSDDTKNYLLEKLSRTIGRPVEVIEHKAGVRPASRDRRPILGILDKRQAIFNGLGARGGMIAPWCAQHLLEHLIDGMALDPEVDIRRFNSF